MDVALSSDTSPNAAGPLITLLGDGVLDAELAALASLLVQARVPVVVAGAVEPARRSAVLDALLGSLPAATHRVSLAGPLEDFRWLPEAEALGWRPDGPTPGRGPGTQASADNTFIDAGELIRPDGGSPWAGVVRIAIRAISLGYGLGGSMGAASLEDVLGALRASPYRLTEDELSRLGLVVVLNDDARGGMRVEAAHYVRPVARDMHGHVQKLGPAVLTTWDATAGRFEHFGWGVTPELAMRTGRRAGDFEIELDRRTAAFAAGQEPGPEAAPPHDHPAHAGHDHATHDHDHARNPG